MSNINTGPPQLYSQADVDALTVRSFCHACLPPLTICAWAEQLMSGCIRNTQEQRRRLSARCERGVVGTEAPGAEVAESESKSGQVE